ncbi:MAG: helix-turn-helix transcriptional regulator [Veillonella sp.]|uniref:helix-turn-helix domain-containing protein n=1 Tax=Veillonella sp. TaxID=1926307 RepID=UPI0025D59B04|nr:helix-turn-helix transcriptional regulator [Veillonella sp.]MBE6079871.1 helix-turn-helix transcriptional regulator [Veillonella sp.]
MSIGEKIKTRRIKLKMTQEELAERSGLSRTTISNLETGTQTVVTNTTMLALANALDCKPSYFF